jgi:sporulation protein YlmC with PRC-barrel domain
MPTGLHREELPFTLRLVYQKQGTKFSYLHEVILTLRDEELQDLAIKKAKKAIMCQRTGYA